MSLPSPKNSDKDSPVVDVQVTSSTISMKDKVGDAANNWLARNRSLVLRQTPVWAQSLVLILSGLGSIAVVGGFLFRIDEVVTVQGQLKSIGGTVEVKSPAGGRISEIYFSDGQYVEKGSLLVKFDTRQAVFQKAALSSQIQLEKKQLNTQLNIYSSQIKTAQGTQQVIQKRLNTKNKILDEMKVLVDQGGFQRIQYLEQKDQAFALEKQISEVSEQISRIKLESERLKLQSQKSIDSMQASLNNADLQLQYQNVLAPASGLIFDPQVSVEGVLNSGQRIVSIVPQKGLFAEVYVSNKDIGYIKTGQGAKVRVDAFPFSRYGEIESKVSQIGADALQPDQINNFYRFPVKLDMASSTLDTQGISIPLKAGMAVTTNLKLRDKRVISLISDVFVDQTDSIRSLRQQ